MSDHAPQSDCPQVSVTWYEAAAYCNWLSEREGISEEQWCYEPNASGEFAEGMKPVANYLDRTGYRLPSEAEWECACRAESSTERYYGNTEELLADYAWYDQNSAGKTHPVGSLKPNDFGLFDMLGNVWEWCHDRYGEYPTADSGPSDVLNDFREIEDQNSRVLRGGSFNDGAAYARSAYRCLNQPVYRNLD